MLDEEYSGRTVSKCKGPEVVMSDVSTGNLRKASGSEGVRIGERKIEGR